MNRLSPRFMLILAVGVSIAVLSASAVGASGEFTLEMDNEIETPEQSVDRDEIGEHTITSVGVSEAGDSFNVDVTIPADENRDIEVQLRSGTDLDPFGPPIDDAEVEDGSETVSLTATEPGTYILLLQAGDDTEDILPVVVNGYDVDAAYDETGGELTVGATVSPTASEGEPSEVEAVVWNDETQERYTLSQQSGEQYETTLSLDEFDDDYQVYVAALGDDTLETTGEKEILGIGEAESGLDTSNGDDDSGSDDTNSDDNGGQSGQGVPVDSGDDDTDNVDDSEDDDVGDSDESVIQPNESDDTDEDTEAETDGSDDDNEDTEGDEQIDDEIPLSPAVAIIAILTAGIVLSRKK